MALTRRAGAELAGVQRERDPTLVRHIYDLHVIREHYEFAEIAALEREVMQADVDSRGHELPAYRDNPPAETLRAVELSAADPDFAANYATFRRNMVYGEGLEFEVAITMSKGLAIRVRETQ